jgi:hypothetical protein
LLVPERASAFRGVTFEEFIAEGSKLADTDGDEGKWLWYLAGRYGAT